MTLLLEARKANATIYDGEIYLEGIFLQADTLNNNKRIYPAKVLDRAVAEIRQKMSEGKFYGQMGHPDGATTDPMRISHIIETLEKRGNNWYGRAKLIDEGAGKIARSILKAGGTLGVSSRGIGSVHESNGQKIVGNDYKLLAIDIVENPSCEVAFVDAVLEHCELVNEQATALEILRSIPGIGDQLAAQQEKYGLDWDNVQGNFIPGHAGFPSVDEKIAQTQLQRWETDKQKMLAKLKQLQTNIDMAMDGLSANRIRKYHQALEHEQDPFRRSQLHEQLRVERGTKRGIQQAVQHLSYLSKRGYK